ncbi:phospholipase D-like domain-containing protein [Bradyrhizobium sp. U531]|uniref:phospholipase D-like domain-containing protein n=1 Tax=Bradyrhizobium sp. U531 TaxID=3053458 RepID=UPI003F42B9CE
MMAKKPNGGRMVLKAYRGDAKTLLAFNLDKSQAKDLAGFTIQCKPDGQPAYYIYNELQFERPADHAQDSKEPARSSINAPIHKFRWLHVPGSVHQGVKPFRGKYAYTVTPRYFDNGVLTPLDPDMSVSTTILVDSFSKQSVELGFTRGFVQSQAFVNHFGKTAPIQPSKHDLVYDTSEVAGTNAHGEKFTFADEYEWMGFTAREKIIGLLTDVLKNKDLVVDVFAYDLSESDTVGLLLKLAGQGRVRIILDNAALHHNKEKPTPEDRFEQAFNKAAKGKDLLLRGKFGRYSHDKVMIVYRKGAKKNSPQKVLTGSTNFSITGLYVNSNHVLVYNDAEVAGFYAGVFEQAWTDGVKKPAFIKSAWSKAPFVSTSSKTPKTSITFSPHDEQGAAKALAPVVAQIAKEAKKPKGTGSVLFAVMEMANGNSPVYEALKTIHANDKVFSYGISDNPNGIYLYPVGKKTGVLVTGKPVQTQLPPPFNQVPNIAGVKHQIHHKFVVCGFNGDDPVVFCGSSNLASGGEENNGDNLLTIRDKDIATVFAVEALALVDHFNFLDSTATGGKKAKPKASKAQAALDAKWFLSTTDGWTTKYFDTRDLHCADREMFG